MLAASRITRLNARSSRQRVVHLGHVLEAGAVLADQLFVHVHDEVVVLGVDRGDAAGLRQDLQHLPDVAEIDHAALAAGGDVGGEDLDRWDGRPRPPRPVAAAIRARSCPAPSCERRSRNGSRRPIPSAAARSPAARSSPSPTRAKSMIVVVPPCSAASLTRAGPSVIWCWVVPGTTIGQRQWTCGSIPPGMTICPEASTVRPAPIAARLPGAPIAAILPPATPISAGFRAGRQHREPAGDDDVEHLLALPFAALFRRRGSARSWPWRI